MKMTRRVNPFQIEGPSDTMPRLAVSAKSQASAPATATVTPGTRPAYQAVTTTGMR